MEHWTIRRAELRDADGLGRCLNAAYAQYADRIDDLRDVLRAEMAKNHSEMLHRFGDLDTRLTRIESRLNMK